MSIVNGSSKNDWLVGTGGDDTLKGAGGDDTLKGGGGADTLNGGAGIDTAIYADSPGQVYVDLETGSGLFNYAQGDKLIGIENVQGSAYFDLLYGNGGANTLSGLDGDDYLDGEGGADVLDGGYGSDDLRGRSGIDTLIGGYGDDILEGGSEGDILHGGEGDDVVSYRESPMGVVVMLTSNFVSGGDADGDALSSVEGAYGSEFSDYLWGNDGSNSLKGYGGNDSLRGFGGADQLEGGEGQDALYGMDGDDFLFGDEGNDRLDGGRGTDMMKGGGGSDTLIWSAIEDTGKTVQTADYVLEFNRAEGDRLDVSGIDANVYAAGDQAFTFIGSSAFSGTPGEINYIHQNGETIIQMQTGMSTDIEGIIRIYGIVTPEASWFAL